MASDTVHQHHIVVREARGSIPDLVKTLVDIDLQTFSESTFSHYTASAFLRNGSVYLLHADEAVIGTCVCIRCWDAPEEAMLLSMGLRPGWRGQGLGQRFLVDVLARLRERGLIAVTLLVGEDNRRALKIYEAAGFLPTGEVTDDPRTGEQYLHLRAPLQELAAPPRR